MRQAHAPGSCARWPNANVVEFQPLALARDRSEAQLAARCRDGVLVIHPRNETERSGRWIRRNKHSGAIHAKDRAFSAPVDLVTRPLAQIVRESRLLRAGEALDPAGGGVLM